MTTSAFVLMISVQLIVTAVTAYLFFKVLKGEKKRGNKEANP